MRTETIQQIIVESLLIAAVFCVYLPAWLVPPQRKDGPRERKREWISLTVTIAVVLLAGVFDLPRDAWGALVINGIGLHLLCGLVPGLAGKWSLWWSVIASLIAFAVVLAFLADQNVGYGFLFRNAKEIGIGFVLLGLLSTVPNYLIWQIRHRRPDH